MLMYTLYTNGKVRAYFSHSPKLYGEGKSRVEALKDLSDKLNAMLLAISRIQRGE